MILCLITDQYIPFIDDDNKFVSAGSLDIRHRTISSFYRIRNQLSVLFLQFLQDPMIDIFHNAIRISGIHHAPLDIKMNHIILIQMFFKGLCLMDRIVRKQFSGITAFAVICRKHLRCDRLSETSGTTAADKFRCSTDHSVGVFQKRCFIYIDFRMNDFRKCFISRI